MKVYAAHTMSMLPMCDYFWPCSSTINFNVDRIVPLVFYDICCIRIVRSLWGLIYMRIAFECFFWFEAGLDRHSCFLETRSFAFFWSYGERPLFDWKTKAPPQAS